MAIMKTWSTLHSDILAEDMHWYESYSHHLYLNIRAMPLKHSADEVLYADFESTWWVVPGRSSWLWVYTMRLSW